MMLRTPVLALMMVLTAGTAFAADPVEGIWKTVANDDGYSGYIEVKPCGSAFCGTLIRIFDRSGAEKYSDNIGKKIVWDMRAFPDGRYDDGKVWSPERDKIYDADMRLIGDTLTVRGCAFGICRNGEPWSRVK